MRISERARIQTAEGENMEAGATCRWVTGDELLDAGLAEKYNSEAEIVNISLLFFADDTIVIGNREELETGVRRMTEEMARFEERTHPDKVEKLVFGQADSENIRMLGCCMGPEEDIKQRIRRAGGL